MVLFFEEPDLGGVGGVTEAVRVVVEQGAQHKN